MLGIALIINVEVIHMKVVIFILLFDTMMKYVVIVPETIKFYDDTKLIFVNEIDINLVNCKLCTQPENN